MKRITAFEVVDGGVHHPDTWPGIGVVATEFDSVATGIGDNPHEAFGDALQSLAMEDWGTDDVELLAAFAAMPETPTVPDGGDAYYYVCVLVR